MSDSFLDHLPSRERQKLRKMMSPEAYERLREKVKGPEDLEKELKRGERMAELRFHLESEPTTQEQIKAQVENDVREQGIEQMTDLPVSLEQKAAIEQRNFHVTVASHPSTHQDEVTIVPEGNVQEAIPLTSSMSEKYVGQFLQSRHQS